jgi:hypothetical protein
VDTDPFLSVYVRSFVFIFVNDSRNC